MAKQFHGYRVKSTNITVVDETLRHAKEQLALAASEEYHRLLSEEICEVVDDIAMNIKARPNDISLLDLAVNRLNERISYAETHGTGTEYDLRSGVSIIPDKGYTYLVLTTWNPALEPAFAATEGIEPYTVGLGVTMGDTEEQDARAKKWERLYKRNPDNPAIMMATLTSLMQVDPNKLTFPSVEDRAKVRARRQLTSHWLNQYANGNSITGDVLMPLLDKALTKMLSDEVERDLNMMTDRLKTILPELTLELLTCVPGQQTPDVC